MPMRKSIRILMLLEKRSTPLLTKTTMTSMPGKKHWLPIPKAEAEAEEEAEAEVEAKLLSTTEPHPRVVLSTR